MIVISSSETASGTWAPGSQKHQEVIDGNFTIAVEVPNAPCAVHTVASHVGMVDALDVLALVFIEHQAAAVDAAGTDVTAAALDVILIT